jgi:hypothetical protein
MEKRTGCSSINSARFEDGAFRNLYGKLRDDRDKFFNYFRMSISSFDELVVKFPGTIQARQDLVQGFSSINRSVSKSSIFN